MRDLKSKENFKDSYSSLVSLEGKFVKLIIEGKARMKDFEVTLRCESDSYSCKENKIEQGILISILNTLELTDVLPNQMNHRSIKTFVDLARYCILPFVHLNHNLNLKQIEPQIRMAPALIDAATKQGTFLGQNASFSFHAIFKQTLRLLITT